VARKGQDVEWFAPDDQPNEPGPSITPASNPYRWDVPGWRYLPNRTARRVLAGLALIVAFVSLARLGADNKLPAAPPKPPQWLQHLPLSAPLSPYMAAECRHHHCQAIPASGTDLWHVRAGLSFSFTVTAARILDRNRNLRGIAITVGDRQHDVLTVNAVRVPAAPAHWNADTATLDPNAYIRRWVLRDGGAIWLTESRLTQGNLDTDEEQYAVLFGRAAGRVPAGELEL
jgi:hypothetical protein